MNDILKIECISCVCDCYKELGIKLKEVEMTPGLLAAFFNVQTALRVLVKSIVEEE